MLRLGSRTRRSGRGDEGVALPVVLGLGFLMMTLVATSLSLATSGLRAADTDQDSTGALNAAYAGVQEYVARVNADPTYAAAGNPDSPFNTGPALERPADVNPAFGLGTDGTWATVPGSGGVATFRYEVDKSLYQSSGTLRLRSTGRVGQSTRTVLATVKRSGFVDFVYFTNYEIADPALTGIGGITASSTPRCDVYGWAGRNNYACLGNTNNLPRFDSLGVINGSLHSNDTIAMTCSIFNGQVTTGDPGGKASYNGGKNYDNNAGASCPPHNSDGTPVTVTSVPLVAMPATNAAMQNETRSDLSSSPGCLYTGPTTVVFNSNGTMTVTSPWTRFTNTRAGGGSSTPNLGSNPARCGLPGTGVGELGSVGGATVPQLDLNLLYVQTVPLVSSDPNYASTTSTPTGLTCLGSDGVLPVTGSAASAGWTFGTSRYPLLGEIPAMYFGTGSTVATAQWNTSSGPVAYGCRAGDLYVKGVVTTQTTVASDNYTYVTGDLTVADLTQDLLGLVANNAVIVWNPASSPSTSILTDSQRNINAAILSVAHSFTVQNFNKGTPRGILAVTGSIAQNFKGKIRNAGYSYTANYRYDPLLATVTPPKFLAPVNTTFAVSRYASVAPAFAADGRAR